jgi:HK97 family phage portal protein
MEQPVYTNWTLQKAVKEGYKINGWVYRSVFLISKAISQVAWQVTNEDGEPIEKHYLSGVLNRPNDNISRQDLFELITSWLLLAGNSYLKKVTVQGKTAELWPISPDRLAPVPSKQIDEWLKGYALDQKQRVEYEPLEIIHHKFFNPANPLLGIAPLEAAAKTVDIDNGQQDWNKAAMQNRGVVDGVMAFDRNFDTQDQVDKIAERLNESIAGPKNARKIKVVGSNAKYTRMGLTAVEMDFGESRKFNRDEIFIIFGMSKFFGCHIS